MGAAPLHLGNKEACKFIQPNLGNLINSLGKIYPNATTIIISKFKLFKNFILSLR